MQQGNGGNQLWNMQAQLQESYPGTNNGTPNSVTNSHHGSVTSTGTNTGLGMGIPFERYPVVNGVRINLFVYYYMVSYVGGFVKAYQEQKFPLIAKQLGIPANNQPVPQAPQIKNTSSHQEQLHQHQIHLQQNFQEAQHKTLLQQQQLLQKKATKNSPTQYSQASTPHDVPQSPHVPINKANKITKPPLKTAKSRVSSINEEKIVTVFAKGNRKPDVIKNYTPYTTTHDRPGGLDILNIERVGEQLDDMKPVFLYFPELGKVDIKALSLGLLSGISAEINVALNVLLIISSDPNTHIPFEHCKILLDSLSLLGKKVIGKLWNFKYKSHLSESTKKLGKNMDYVKPKSRIDKIFEKYSRQFGDEDYTIEVNAFTSQEISSTKPDPPHLHPNRYDDKMNDKMNDNSSPPTSLNQSIINES
ncbi:SWI/SNF chromatin-remodeling complex subunit SWI1 [Pichia kudriavzevii]|uniref:SWI/SNF chromatin-remodeling complex subunit SWI1 n=1 Tax=Pichia kudriavzevii TaxID=4909 RepID=A0A1V2LMV5_PICKU|nr:SWI/SNF chromatin-remodeling complex subunit SWI1 [Pichia kudriavzevii]